MAFAFPDYVVFDYEKVISTYFSDSNPTIVDYLTNILYPPVFDGSHGYKDEISRIALTISEYELDCNAVYLDKAFDGNTYSYVGGPWIRCAPSHCFFFFHFYCSLQLVLIPLSIS